MCDTVALIPLQWTGRQAEQQLFPSRSTEQWVGMLTMTDTRSFPLPTLKVPPPYTITIFTQQARVALKVRHRHNRSNRQGAFAQVRHITAGVFLSSMPCIIPRLA